MDRDHGMAWAAEGGRGAGETFHACEERCSLNTVPTLPWPREGIHPAAGMDKAPNQTLVIKRKDDTHEPARATLSARGVCAPR
jgi:hypothetical protein